MRSTAHRRGPAIRPWAFKALRPLSQKGPLARAALLIPAKGIADRISVARYDRASPIEVVVDADPQDVFEELRPVVEDRAEAGIADAGRASGGNDATRRHGDHCHVASLQADEEILRLERPASHEHPLEAGAAGEAPRIPRGADCRPRST